MIYFYLPASNQVYSEVTLYQNTGFSPEANPSALAANGIYTVTPTEDPYDRNLYFVSNTYSISGDYAIQQWVATPRSLDVAKSNGGNEAKTAANTQEVTVVAESGFSTDLLTAVSSQDTLDRPTRYQEILDAMSALSDTLDSNLAAIDTATTVDEINNIVNKPTGIINIGRGQFGGPYDLNASNYVSFNSVSMIESETELYAPATSSVVPYQGYPPDDFNSGGPIFTLGNYLIQIRETATGMVIAEFEVPLSTDGSNEDIAF